MTMNDIGRYLAIDHGERRIGVALSDPFRLFAKPHVIIERKTQQDDFDILKEIIKTQQVAKIIVGLPTGTDGGIGKQGRIVIHWARKLANVVDLPIILWDESFSSTHAAEIRGKKGKGTPLDDVAAATILQDYIHARETYSSAGQSLEEYRDIP